MFTCQQVYFRDGEEAAGVERAENCNTMLTAWFELNRRDPQARENLYCKPPYHYTFDNRERKWSPRRRNAE